MNGSFLRFYVHEGHRHHHSLVWEWLLQQANKLGIRGGSAFKVYLPIVSAGAEHPPVPRKNDASDSSSGHGSQPTPSALKGVRVLVLDDEDSIRSLLQEGLSAHGLRVACAATAEEAAELVAARPYDALLCDLRLKSSGAFSDGNAAAAHVCAAAGSHQPLVIFMTGEYVDQHAQNVKANGALFLQKPFRILDVLLVMKEAFELAKASAKR